MTDRQLRLTVLMLTLLAVLAVVLGPAAAVRTPFVIAFAFLAPGLAITRFVPTVGGTDRLALASAISMSLNITVSLALVALGEWSGDPVLLALAGVALIAAAAPRQSPWQARREREDRRRNEQIRERRRAQYAAYDQVQSDDPAQRRQGLVALSWLLEDDDRGDEARRLRASARLAEPPRLRIDDSGVVNDNDLRTTHQRVRAEDPETRRRGLFEVAALLDDAGRNLEAATLRDIAASDDIPEL